MICSKGLRESCFGVHMGKRGTGNGTAFGTDCHRLPFMSKRRLLWAWRTQCWCLFARTSWDWLKGHSKQVWLGHSNDPSAMADAEMQPINFRPERRALLPASARVAMRSCSPPFPVVHGLKQKRKMSPDLPSCFWPHSACTLLQEAALCVQQSSWISRGHQALASHWHQ